MPITLIIYTILVLTMVLLPLVRSDYWIFRSMEYPRLQKWVLAGIGMVACLVWGDYSGWLFWAGLGAFALSFSFLSYQIYPHLPLARREVLEAGATDEPIKGRCLSLMIANVYQPNRKAERVLDLVSRLSPDIVLLLETNDWWKTQMQPLERTYPYTACWCPGKIPTACYCTARSSWKIEAVLKALKPEDRIHPEVRHWLRDA